MSRPSWKSSLSETLRRLQPDPDRVNPAEVRVAVVGVGQELRGDDAVGLFAVRRPNAALPENGALLVIEAGPAPENLTGVLRRFEPDLVVFVDAAGLDAVAGTVRWVSMDEITGLGASTHALPLATLAGFLTAQLGCAVGLIGVRPGDTGIGAPLTAQVEAAVNEIVRGLVEILGYRLSAHGR